MGKILALIALSLSYFVGCSQAESQSDDGDQPFAQTEANVKTEQENVQIQTSSSSSLDDGKMKLGQNTGIAISASPDAIFCPTGSWYSVTEKMCVTESHAIGPFTRTMISLCKKYGGGDVTCESERWKASFLRNQTRSGAANRKLLAFYSVRQNYDDVFDEVLTFYPAGRRNGCVAFLSTALRRSGTVVPLSGYINGESVSLVTKPFAQYLQDRLGWIKIASANNLQPGDVVLTQDDKRYPGYPSHTYMFYGWSDQDNGIGWVIDNQDFIHERNVFGYGTYNFTPFAYALRSPE